MTRPGWHFLWPNWGSSETRMLAWPPPTHPSSLPLSLHPLSTKVPPDHSRSCGWGDSLSLWNTFCIWISTLFLGLLSKDNEIRSQMQVTLKQCHPGGARDCLRLKSKERTKRGNFTNWRISPFFSGVFLSFLFFFFFYFLVFSRAAPTAHGGSQARGPSLMHCRVFSSIPGLYSLDTSSTLQIVTIKNVISSIAKYPW